MMLRRRHLLFSQLRLRSQVAVARRSGSVPQPRIVSGGPFCRLPRLRRTVDRTTLTQTSISSIGMQSLSSRGPQPVLADPDRS